MRALNYVKEKNHTVVVSTGMNTWELPLAIASSMNLKILAVIPDIGDDHQAKAREIVDRFHLDRNKFGYFFLENRPRKRVKDSWPDRDREIAAISDAIIPVSIRSGGNLEKLISRFPGKIVNDFRVSYRKASRPRPRYADGINRNDLADEDILIHFTRSAAGPWPDESDFEFYRAIVASNDEYCRSARQTLLHILETKTIFASAKNIRDGYRVVGFSRLSPENVSELFRYRPRLVNPYFEPYGLGLSVKAAMRAGLRQVGYGTPQSYSTLLAEDRPFFQNVGSGGRWEAEQEWRQLGDFHFDGIPESELGVFVPDEAEAEFFRKRIDLRVKPLLTG